MKISKIVEKIIQSLRTEPNKWSFKYNDYGSDDLFKDFNGIKITLNGSYFLGLNLYLKIGHKSYSMTEDESFLLKALYTDLTQEKHKLAHYNYNQKYKQELNKNIRIALK